MARRTTLSAMVLALIGQAVQADDLLLAQRALLLDDSRLPREAALDRLQQVRFAFREKQAQEGDWPLWSRAYGIDGAWDGGLERDGEGLLLGLDRPLGGQWIGGVLAGVSRTRLEDDAGHADSDSTHLGLYAATRIYNQLGFKLGALQGWHELERGERARSWQLFGESSLALDFRDFTLEPFAGLAYVRLDAPNQRAQGVSLPGADEESGYLTLGWRLAAAWYVQQRKWVGRASLALRQDLGSDQLTSRAWSEEGDALRLQGREFERSTLRLDLSLDHELSERCYLGLTYAGHYAEDARDSALAARLSVKF
ncbi:autotransporter outer membrane beta-barrel domain-containing protein [Pseudomonas sp. PDM15]|uniref:autotransporter outer membrane beta-barrel domain-containing protein n=1 Tax=Pseudomonas sp. PDM15 TaxID=2769303 RepID=UPI00177FBAAF|nr:autotransporter outer membrane beta-barrel domain-containing protein [Pseudomonas sp. PDM15]MBD9423895.1 autotransporter outer membrane beta-barrel domain-containing protein [Pseudomonas sp. PDM15]